MLRGLLLSILISSGHISHAISSVNSDPVAKYQVINPNIVQIEPRLTLYCWPGSKSCFLLETALRQWATDNNFILEHQSLIKRHHWRRLAKARLVAQIMQIDDQFRPALYHHLHQANQVIDSDEQLFQLVETSGLDHIRFTNLFYAAETNQALNNIQQRADRLSISGVPSLLVGDKWLLDAKSHKTSRSFIDTINQLIVAP